MESGLQLFENLIFHSLCTFKTYAFILAFLSNISTQQGLFCCFCDK